MNYFQGEKEKSIKRIEHHLSSHSDFEYMGIFFDCGILAQNTKAPWLLTMLNGFTELK